jgi:hypothetical protein
MSRTNKKAPPVKVVLLKNTFCVFSEASGYDEALGIL